jgi:hypothetical protein
MRRAAKVDANQAEIVEALREIGCSVQPLHMVGRGCPDLLVGYRKNNWVFEVKDGAKPPSKRRLTPDEQDWFDDWRGTAVVVKSAEEAIKYVSEYENPADVPPF